jgi:hypothetical protein
MRWRHISLSHCALLRVQQADLGTIRGYQGLDGRSRKSRVCGARRYLGQGTVDSAGGPPLRAHRASLASSPEACGVRDCSAGLRARDLGGPSRRWHNPVEWG